jgi:hypothetical protein
MIFKNKIAYYDYQISALNKYGVMNINFIYLILRLIIGAQKHEKHMWDMCHLIYCQIKLKVS